MAVYLVCEGIVQGLDMRFLRALVIQFHNLNVLVEPAGGNKGHRAVRAFLEGRSSRDVAIAVEDRDYLPQGEANATWANPAGKRFTWRRHSIENYLLHPRVLLDWFNDIRAGYSWAGSLPATEVDTAAFLRALAVPFLDNHAAEVLKDELVREISRIGSLSFGPAAPAPGAGMAVPGQVQWLLALQQEAARLFQTCHDVGAWPSLQPADIAARYSTLVAQFQSPAFLDSGDYLIDMKGKNLLAALTRFLVGLGAPARLDRDTLADELLRVLERIYQPSSIYQPDDFVELAAVLRQC